MVLVNLWFLPSYGTGELSVSYSHIASVCETSMSIKVIVGVLIQI